MKKIRMLFYVTLVLTFTTSAFARPFCDIGGGTTISSLWCILTQAGADAVNNHYPGSWQMPREVGDLQMGGHNIDPAMYCTPEEAAQCGG